MPAPLAPGKRAMIAAAIRAGLGCREIARMHHVSPSTVTKTARAAGLWFENDWMTTTAAECRRQYCEADRADREGQLLDELLALPQTTRQRDGRETKAHRRLTYALYDLQRHHDRT